MKNWYLIYTNPRKERYVVRQLEDRGIEVFYPILQFQRGYRRGIRVEPYFPQYVFVRIDLASACAKDLRWMAGVRKLVHFDGRPAIVPDVVVNLLRDRLSRLEHEVMSESEWRFKPGQRVLVVDGPLSGVEAIFQKGLRSSVRVQVLLHMLGTWTRTEIDGRKIRPV
jgi:transcription elongation factor/antiterminator RfaH